MPPARGWRDPSAIWGRIEPERSQNKSGRVNLISTEKIIMDQSLPNRKGQNQQRITLIITFKLAGKKKIGITTESTRKRKTIKEVLDSVPLIKVL